MIKVILFDCGGVLLRPQDNGTYARWEAALGYRAGELAEKLWSSAPYKRAEIGELSEDAFWAEMALHLPLSTTEQLSQLRDEMWGVFTLNEQVLGWVDRLRARYRVAVLSNATEILEEMLHSRFQIGDRFEAIYNSARLGVAKPDPAIYRKVLQSLNVAASETLFIDDRAENVTAAAVLGMHVLWYVGDAELDRQLQVYLP